MRNNLPRKILTISGFAFGFYVLAVVLQPIFFEDRFGVATYISGVNVSYQTASGAKETLQTAYADYLASEIEVNGEVYKAKDFVTEVNIEDAVGNALLAQQRGYFAFSKLMKQSYLIDLIYNNEKISEVLLAAYDTYSISPVDAKINLNGTTTIIAETYGQHLLLAESRRLLQEGLANATTNINYKIISQAPVLIASDLAEVLGDAKLSVSKPVVLTDNGVDYAIPSELLTSWLTVTATTPRGIAAINDYLPLTPEYYFLDSVRVTEYVVNLAKNIDAEAANATLKIQDGAVAIDQVEVYGRRLDQAGAVRQIQEAVLGARTAVLAVETIAPEVRSDNLAEFGLAELISTGWSSFSGSSANRITNIRVGASKFDGVLIAPDETFSFNTTLGAVDASTGFVQELVILSDRTVKEYGGGLCQVSTTAFRAALNAGLTIVARSAHAYAVSYYRPYGADSTIYLPSPDLKFTNDTDSYILIQTRIEGNRLYFDFYGTQREVSVTFSGTTDGTNAVTTVEKVSPAISDVGLRGAGSFTAVIYRNIYDLAGSLIDADKFTSKYNSPDNYPH